MKTNIVHLNLAKSFQFQLGGKPPAVAYWQRNEETEPDQQEQKVV